MEAGAICGLRFSVYYANPRTCFYADPCHLCTYHGVETDLVNLTACVGYELWRVSTTCTLVLESVKATGVIFLLGVGSFVCYRLYHRYNKRSSAPPPTPPREERTTSWESKELLDSCSSREEEAHDIKGEYFGPANHSDDSSSGRKQGRLAFFPPYSCCSSKFLEEKQNHRPIHPKNMGHVHSANNPFGRVSYNVHTGVDLFSTAIELASLPTSVSSAPPTVVSRLHCISNAKEVSLPKGPSRPCPKSLKLCRKRLVATLCPQANASEVIDLAKEVNKLDDCQSDSDGSLPSGHSPRCYLDEDDIDGDDEADDDGALLSNLNFSRSEDQCSCSGSLKGNFSPGSLIKRHLETLGPWNDRLPPDDTEHYAQTECLSLQRGIFTLQSNNSASSEESESVNVEKQDTLNYSDVSVALGFEPFSSNPLVRDSSFGSECSEMSIDTTAFNDVGRCTQANIDRILKEIDDVKKDCLDLESHMGNVDFHGPTPMAYTELVKSPLSDISECSDSRRGQSLVDCLRMQRTAAVRDIGQSWKSLDSSIDQTSHGSSGRVVNSSTNLSLEWDSMKCGASNSNTSIRSKQRKWALGSGPADSGSDFGTPLTNGSPELTGGRCRSGSVASLEWEEEFGPCTRAEAEEESFQPQSFRDSSNLDDEPSKVVNPYSKQEAQLSANNNSQRIVHKGSPPSNLAVTNDRAMWSSVESGYIDEFSESCGSQQVTPLTDETNMTPTAYAPTKKVRPIRAKTKDPIVDSAYCEATEEEQIRTWPVVGDKIKLNDFCSMSQNFVSICENLGIDHVRPIHKDGYSAIRAVVLQMLCQGYSPLECSGGVDQVKRKFSKWVRCHYQWLTKWNFAQKLNYGPENGLQGMLECLQTLDWLLSCVLSSTHKEQSAVDIFNTDPETEVQAMEAIKMLIMKSVIEMHESLTIDEKVPMFALLLFSRDTSRDPKAFLSNHLNLIGDIKRLDELDVFLLGYALGITICVLHPGNGQKNEIITYHPDCNIGTWPEIYLLFNDDKQQYGVIAR